MVIPMTNNVREMDTEEFEEEFNISRRELGKGVGMAATATVGASIVSGNVSAQTADNYIRGTVEESGTAVENATVVAVPHDQSKSPLATSTDSSGNYAFEQGDLHDGENLYHVISRDGSESDPKRGQENYPFVAAQGDAIPPDSEDLHAWYDATEISASDGDAISTWPDESGNGYDLTSGTAPTYKASVINGNPVVRHDGVDDYLDVNWAAFAQPNHIFAVWRFQALDNNNITPVYHGENGNNRHTLGERDTDNWRIFSGSNVEGGSKDTNNHISAALYDGANSYLRLEGGQVLSGDAGSEGMGGMTTGSNNSQAVYGQVDIGEILIYPMDKSAVESDIESYLSDKWGITI